VRDAREWGRRQSVGILELSGRALSVATGRKQNDLNQNKWGIYLCYLNNAPPFYRNLKKGLDLLCHPAVG
jgi:hypothetical protein